MSFIDTTPASFSPRLTEDNFQENFGQILVDNGWTIATNFKKTVVPKSHYDTSTISSHTYHVAQHYIYQNANGKMFGMAITASKTYSDGDEPDPSSTDFETKMTDMFNGNKTRTHLYFYMLEKLPDSTIISQGSMVTVVGQSGGMLETALDIEVHETEMSEVGTILKAEPDVMQSPITRTSLRADFLEDIDHPEMFTNWWKDSEIRMKGQVDSNGIFVVLQADNVPAWENNVVPTVPLYFGELVPVDPGDDAVAMFAGTLPPGNTEETVGDFDFDDPNSTGGEKIMPLLKNYPSHPSNGIDAVMVSRSRFGSRYQEYFLSWNTPSNLMPPDRAKDDDQQKEYPRAWNNIWSSEYKYGFNPSRYSDKVHTSRVYVVHPEEGVRGYLSNTVGLNAINFNAGKLRIRKQNCPTKTYEVYRFFSIGGVSPLTKRPGTPYRPMGLGIYEEDYTP